MKKLIQLAHVSLDGFAAKKNGDMDWIYTDNLITHDVTKDLTVNDTALYGRKTYQLMKSYWTTVPDNPKSSKAELLHAKWIENVHKVVVSKTMKKVPWNNSTIIKENIADEIKKLKQKSATNIWLFGSPTLSQFLSKLGLIDEYRLWINPIILGSGLPVFKDIKNNIDLELEDTKVFKSEVIRLQYFKRK